MLSIQPARTAAGALLLAAAACVNDRTPTQPDTGTPAAAVALATGANTTWGTMPLRGSEAASAAYSFGMSRTGSANSPASNGISYHGGSVLQQTKVVAIYWSTTAIYANQPTPGTTGPGSQDASLIGYFLSNLGGSNYFNINTTYYDLAHAVQNVVTYTGYWANNQNVPPSDGSAVTDGTIQTMITNGLQTGKLTYDPQTVYAVFTAGYTNLGGNFGPNHGAQSNCAYHTRYQPSGYGVVIYAALPYSSAYFGYCTNATAFQNGEPADAEVNVLAHEIEESTTDYLANAWYADGSGYETADLCNWQFGPDNGPYPAQYSNGTGIANMKIGTRDFLIQENWINAYGGGCVLGTFHTGFYITSLTGAPQPITSGGTYTLAVAGTSVTPIGDEGASYQWQITYSNGVPPPVTTGFQGGSYSLNVPAGSYSIYVTVTPKDLMGTGTAMETTYPVCTGGGAMHAITPDAKGGCTPPPPQIATVK